MKLKLQHHLTMLEKARAGIVKQHIFFASCMMQTKFVEDSTQPTAWTDMTRIGYNPTFIESLDVPTAIFVLVHEILHIVLKHGLRRGERNHEEWNKCCDYAINIMLSDLGFRVWQWALFNPRYRGMTPEQIYRERQQEHEDDPDDGSSGKSGDRLAGDLRPVPAATPEEREAISHRISKAVAVATATARARGQMPAGFEAVIQATYEDPVPWERLLVDYVSACVVQDENWNRPSRRYAAVILPSRNSPGLAELIIVADSSGSMFSRPIFERIAVAVNHVVTVVKPMIVRVIWADDDECSSIDVFERGDEVVLHPKGGGGTDMRKPLEYVERFAPEVVLLLTDGYTPWPDVAPPYPLIIGCTTDAPCPDYARTVRIEVK